MTEIRSFIVDDETANRDVLRTMLQRHCKEIKVIGEASSADEGYQKIMELKPDLVFLDIKMPGKNGFEMLKLFQDIHFDIIFVSAFDEYAIQAFEFNAVDYVLKPIDYNKLINATNRAIERIQLKNKNSEEILHFIHSFDDRNELINKISLHNQDKVIFLELNDICFIEANAEYSVVHTVNQQKILSSRPLKKYDDLLSSMGHFIRINKSILINTNYIRQYSKGTPCSITLRNGEEFIISRRKKTEILDKMNVVN